MASRIPYYLAFVKHDSCPPGIPTIDFLRAIPDLETLQQEILDAWHTYTFREVTPEEMDIAGTDSGRELTEAEKEAILARPRLILQSRQTITYHLEASDEVLEN